MRESDLNNLAELRGDSVVMKFYPAQKTRRETAEWISWTQANYARYGDGLWVIERLKGEFLVDRRLRGKKPKLSASQEKHLVSLYRGWGAHHGGDRRAVRGGPVDCVPRGATCR